MLLLFVAVACVSFGGKEGGRPRRGRDVVYFFFEGEGGGRGGGGGEAVLAVAVAVAVTVMV